VDLADVLADAAEAAHLTGNGSRAAELVRQAIDLSGGIVSEARAAVWYERLGSYLLPTGEREQALAALDRAADLLPANPPTAERARVLATVGNAMRVAMRHEDALRACTEAIALADAVGEASAGFRARDIANLSLCHIGRADEGLVGLEQACTHAQERELPMDILCPFALRSDALMTLGRWGDAAEVATEGLTLARRLGVERGVGTLLAVNAAEARIGLGDWTGADTVLAEALRRGGEFWSHQLHRLRAQLAIGRGEIDAAHRHLAAGAAAALEPRTAAEYAALTAELALLEGRLDDADAAIDEGVRADSDDLALADARLCAVGLRVTASRVARPPIAGFAPRPAAVEERTRDLLGRARRCAGRAAGRSPDVAAWAAVAEAEHAAGQRRSDQPRLWHAAAQAAVRLGRSHLAAYCQGRHAAALAAAGAATSDVATPARAAHRTAVALGAWPLRHDLEALARSARITLTDGEGRAVKPGRTVPGLSAREEEVLALVARGYTNREIATELTISVKTASLHVSHILQKLGTRNRTEAAAFARPPSWPG
jgi:DNA-binding CsgD family transcriptional regulator/tetratricopeptide (TPR) repeat protein